MTFASSIMVLASGILHPLWNILLKKSDNKDIFYLHIHIVFIVLFSFLLLIFPLLEISFTAWVFILLSSLAHFFYQIYLCKTYHLSDISLSYPIIRSSPVFVALAGFIFLKEVPSFIAVLGILLVIFGAQIINLDNLSLKEITASFKTIDQKVMYAAVMTAMFSAVYSVIDKKGVLYVHPVFFFYLFFAFSGILFAGYVFAKKENRKLFLDVYRKNKYIIVLASLLEFASYILILYAFRLSKVAYVIALRQISIVFAVIFAVLFLKEKYAKVRIIASVVIFTGVLLIIVFGR